MAPIWINLFLPGMIKQRLIGSSGTTVSVLASAKLILAELLCWYSPREAVHICQRCERVFSCWGFIYKCDLPWSHSWQGFEVMSAGEGVGGGHQIITQQVLSITFCIKAQLWETNLHLQTDTYSLKAAFFFYVHPPPKCYQGYNYIQSKTQEALRGNNTAWYSFYARWRGLLPFKNNTALLPLLFNESVGVQTSHVERLFIQFKIASKVSHKCWLQIDGFKHRK